jgi:predicted AlkP superfamily phosphohydrolase/phosphomutase
VALDCALKGQRCMVMHKARPRAQPPEWGRPELVRGILRPGLNDAVASPDVVQQKITVGGSSVAERRRHGESPAIDHGARGRRVYGLT